MERERLLTRLTSTLDTVDNDGELVNAVHAIRQLAGHRWFTELTAKRTTIPLAHDDQDTLVRLRGLGFILRRANHPDLDVNAALMRTREALVEGDAVAHSDLMVTLACLRDLLVYAADEIKPSPPEPLDTSALRDIFPLKGP